MNSIVLSDRVYESIGGSSDMYDIQSFWLVFAMSAFAIGVIVTIVTVIWCKHKRNGSLIPRPWLEHKPLSEKEAQELGKMIRRHEEEK